MESTAQMERERLAVRDYACPVCRAAPGQACHRVSSGEGFARGGSQRMDHPHKERTALVREKQKEREAASREEALPVWAKTLLAGLRKELADAKGDTERAEAETRRVLNQLDGKLAADDSGADTFLVDAETANELPLGTGPDVRFADFYTVRYGNHDESGGARVLVIETDAAMQIRPTNFSQQILIVRA